MWKLQVRIMLPQANVKVFALTNPNRLCKSGPADGLQVSLGFVKSHS